MATVGREAERVAATAWRLPGIPAPAVRWFRAAWIILALAALLATVAGPFMHAREIRQFHSPFYELGLRQSYGRHLQSPHAAELRAQGVVAGSELVAISGRPVPVNATWHDVARQLRAAGGPRVPVTIRTPEGAELRLSLRRSASFIEEGYRGSGLSFSTRLILDLGFAGLTNLVILLTALLLFWRRPRDGLAVLLSFSLLLWAATENLSWYSWWRLGLTPATVPLSTLAITAVFICLLLFPDGRFRPRWARWVAAALVGLFFYLNAELIGVEIGPPWFGMPILAVYCAAIVAVVVRYRQTPAGTVHKQQERWLALGLAVGVFWLLCSILLQALPKLFPDNLPLLIWSLVLSGITYSAVTFSIAAGVLVALLRYRLYDAEAAISRSASFAILTLTFGAVFAGSAKGLELGFEAYLGGDAGATPGILAAVLATLIVTPAQSRIQSWASGRFQKELVHLRRDLPDCVNDLREVASLRRLIDEVLDRVSIGVRSSHAAVLLGEKFTGLRGISRAGAGQWLETHRPVAALEACDRADPVFPMRVPLVAAHSAGEPAGWLLLGPRPDGSFYRRDEREALREVADPIARAIRVATVQQARERRHAADRRGLLAALSDLQARIERLEQTPPNGS